MHYTVTVNSDMAHYQCIFKEENVPSIIKTFVNELCKKYLTRCYEPNGIVYYQLKLGHSQHESYLANNGDTIAVTWDL